MDSVFADFGNVTLGFLICGKDKGARREPPPVFPSLRQVRHLRSRRRQERARAAELRHDVRQAPAALTSPACLVSVGAVARQRPYQDLIKEVLSPCDRPTAAARQTLRLPIG